MYGTCTVFGPLTYYCCLIEGINYNVLSELIIKYMVVHKTGKCDPMPNFILYGVTSYKFPPKANCSSDESRLPPVFVD